MPTHRFVPVPSAKAGALYEPTSIPSNGLLLPVIAEYTGDWAVPVFLK